MFIFAHLSVVSLPSNVPSASLKSMENWRELNTDGAYLGNDSRLSCENKILCHANGEITQINQEQGDGTLITLSPHLRDIASLSPPPMQSKATLRFISLEKLPASSWQSALSSPGSPRTALPVKTKKKELIEFYQ